MAANSPKPIMFRPSKSDQLLIEEIMKEFPEKNNADIIRWGLFLSAMSYLGEEKTKDIIAESQYG